MSSALLFCWTASLLGGQKVGRAQEGCGIDRSQIACMSWWRRVRNQSPKETEAQYPSQGVSVTGPELHATSTWPVAAALEEWRQHVLVRASLRSLASSHGLVSFGSTPTFQRPKGDRMVSVARVSSQNTALRVLPQNPSDRAFYSSSKLQAKWGEGDARQAAQWDGGGDWQRQPWMWQRGSLESTFLHALVPAGGRWRTWAWAGAT